MPEFSAFLRRMTLAREQDSTQNKPAKTIETERFRSVLVRAGGDRSVQSPFFPLTPALSPGRGSHLRLSAEKPHDSESSQPVSGSPSPWGEGWGEGEGRLLIGTASNSSGIDWSTTFHR